MALAAILIFWIAAFSISDRGGDIASWVSILFAIIVVMYMLIQGHDMRNLISQGQALLETKMSETTTAVASQADALQLLFKSSVLPQQTKEKPVRAEVNKVPFNPSRFPPSGLVSLYVLQKASQEAKNIQSEDLARAFWAGTATNPAILFTTHGYILGVIYAVESVFESIKISSRGKGVSRRLTVEKFPEGCCESIGDEIKKLRPGRPGYPKKFWSVRLANIDAYFDNL